MSDERTSAPGVAGPPWRAAFAAISRGAAALGLDLAAPLCVGWYNGAVPAPYRVDDDGTPDKLAVLLANTRALWPVFLQALRDDGALAASPNPLEDYLVGGLKALCEGLPYPASVRHAHEAPPRRIAVQAAAEVAGLAPRAPCQLSVHPVYGPWIALRALVVVGVLGPSRRPPIPELPCDDCERHCLRALEAAQAAEVEGAGETGWRRWLAVREACPTGAEHRYGEEQIRYHYTKDLPRLRRLLTRGHPSGSGPAGAHDGGG